MSFCFVLIVLNINEQCSFVFKVQDYYITWPPKFTNDPQILHLQKKFQGKTLQYTCT